MSAIVVTLKSIGKDVPNCNYISDKVLTVMPSLVIFTAVFSFHAFKSKALSSWWLIHSSTFLACRNEIQ